MSNTNDTMNRISDSRCGLRLRHYASDLADMVESGDITELEANERLASFQDRLAADGAWS